MSSGGKEHISIKTCVGRLTEEDQKGQVNGSTQSSSKEVLGCPLESGSPLTLKLCSQKRWCHWLVVLIPSLPLNHCVCAFTYWFRWFQATEDWIVSSWSLWKAVCIHGQNSVTLPQIPALGSECHSLDYDLGPRVDNCGSSRNKLEASAPWKSR